MTPPYRRSTCLVWAISVLMLGTLTWTIIEAPDHGWHSPVTLAGFAVAALSLVVFVVRERTTAHPMLDVTLFRDRRFSAASGAVTITFFALFGFIFLVTQYFQFVRGYGTLSTGARILPVALSIAVASVVGAQLAPRIGTKVVVTTGLLLFGTSFLWISTVAVDASYATVVVPQMVLMGLGMGLISTPATESILLVLPPARAGVGSAVNDATRELGGTLGVAVVGSLFSSVYAGHLADGAFAAMPGRVLAQSQDSVGVALHVAAREPAARLGTPGRVHGRVQHRQRRRRRDLPPGRRGSRRVPARPRGPGADRGRRLRGRTRPGRLSPRSGSRRRGTRFTRMSQRTLVLLKPDAVRRGLVGEILSRYEAKGLGIAALEQRHIDAAMADAHYAEHVERDFYPPLRAFVTSGPLVAAVLEGDEAIEVVRAINGATDGRKAAPGTIRGDLSLSNRENLVHGSDGEESAAREIALWFPEL